MSTKIEHPRYYYYKARKLVRELEFIDFQVNLQQQFPPKNNLGDQDELNHRLDTKYLMNTMYLKNFKPNTPIRESIEANLLYKPKRFEKELNNLKNNSSK